MKLFLIHCSVWILSLATAGAFFAYPAAARTVSVKEIVREAQPQNTITVSLDAPTVTPLPNQTAQTFAISLTPLIASPATLYETTPSTLYTSYKPSEVYTWIQAKIQNRPTAPENARFKEENGRVTDFSPGTVGILPDLRRSSLALLKNLAEQKASTEVVGLTEEPAITLQDTNSLGINEFLAGGISDFSGSSKNRRANIDAGSKKVRGVIIAPGETFSFDKYLGDVTPEDGFKPEIVIKADGLKPELGGGICQVSSTLFRAAMQAGLPIVARKNHAFSVNHYFPPGTDATVYSPYTDLKFINDTPAHILIWPYYAKSDTLMFDLYGTRDNRTVSLEEPVQWDKKPDGSMKTSWTRHVIKDGTTREDIIKSTYLPPAIFKKEEAFVSAPPTASTAPTPNTPLKTEPRTTTPAHN